MSWDDLIEYNRRWVELHRDNQHQAEAARRMTAMVDAMTYLRTDKAVTRVARAMWMEFHADDPEWAEMAWADSGGSDCSDEYANYLIVARAAINALIGQEPRP